MTDPNVKQTGRTQLQVSEPADKAPVSTPTQKPDPGAGSADQKAGSDKSVTPAPEPPSSELKKETARIQLSPEPAPSADQMKSSEPVNPPSVSPQLSASVTPAPEPPSSELKKETARIQLIPEPAHSTDQMKTAESVIPVPQVVPQNSAIGAEAARKKSSMLLSWILLAVSALILIIQIWIYLS